MAPPPPFGANSAAARDIANVLHPYTDLQDAPGGRPAGDHPRQGRARLGRHGKEYIEGMAGLWCASLGFGNERLVEAADEQMRKLPFYHAFTAQIARADDRSGRDADRSARRCR